MNSVQTTHGLVSGRSFGGIDAYLGIPYARAPFGEFRFRAPAAPEAWTVVREATSFGPTAPQKAYANEGGLPDVPEPIIPGEDILTVNVWTPQHRDRPLPVLVWIHGGGYTAGCSANPWYDGSAFARDGVVLVSLNYRLGAEGMLAVEGGDSNRSLRDWIAALEWVRDNAAAFGGDPERVTVPGPVRRRDGGVDPPGLTGRRRTVPPRDHRERHHRSFDPVRRVRVRAGVRVRGGARRSRDPSRTEPGEPRRRGVGAG